MHFKKLYAPEVFPAFPCPHLLPKYLNKYLNPIPTITNPIIIPIIIPRYGNICNKYCPDFGSALPVPIELGIKVSNKL